MVLHWIGARSAKPVSDNDLGSIAPALLIARCCDVQDGWRAVRCTPGYPQRAIRTSLRAIRTTLRGTRDPLWQRFLGCVGSIGCVSLTHPRSKRGVCLCRSFAELRLRPCARAASGPIAEGVVGCGFLRPASYPQMCAMRASHIVPRTPLFIHFIHLLILPKTC